MEKTQSHPIFGDTESVITSMQDIRISDRTQRMLKTFALMCSAVEALNTIWYDDPKYKPTETDRNFEKVSGDLYDCILPPKIEQFCH